MGIRMTDRPIKKSGALCGATMLNARQKPLRRAACEELQV